MTLEMITRARTRAVLSLSLLALLAQAASASSAGDACRLLEPKEIAAIQGEVPRELKPTQRTDGLFQIEACVFVLPTYAKSISLEVTRGATREVRNRWRRMFHARRELRERGEKEERLEPAPVQGVGDESFWLDESPSGALYVLRRDALVRISIGGPAPRTTKVKRAAALARKALRRL